MKVLAEPSGFYFYLNLVGSNLNFSFMKQERQLASINQVAVLIHNDCLYLSQEILGLAFEVGLMIL